MIGGVCLGLATFLSVDVTIIRILFALFAVATGGWGILAYVAMMFILPHATTREQASSATYASGPAGPQSWPWERDGWPWIVPAGRGIILGGCTTPPNGVPGVTNGAWRGEAVDRHFSELS